MEDQHLRYDLRTAGERFKWPAAGSWKPRAVLQREQDHEHSDKLETCSCNWSRGLQNARIRVAMPKSGPQEA